MKFYRFYLFLFVVVVSIPFIGWQLVRRGYLPPLSYLVCGDRCVGNEQLHSLPPDSDLLNSRQALDFESIDPGQTSILVEKSRHRLTLYHRRQPLKSYRVVFGNPEGDKMQEGDRKTPVGVFKVRDLYPHPSWSKFIWLDYPNDTSWEKHLAAKL